MRSCARSAGCWCAKWLGPFVLKWGDALGCAACAFVMTAGQSALDGKPVNHVVWTGVIAAAAYIKGRKDKSPNDESGQETAKP